MALLITFALTPLALSTLSSPYLFSDVSSDTLSWVMVLGLLNTSPQWSVTSCKTVKIDKHDYNKLAFAVITASLIESVIDVAWVLPFSTVILFYLRCRKMQADELLPSVTSTSLRLGIPTETFSSLIICLVVATASSQSLFLKPGNVAIAGLKLILGLLLLASYVTIQVLLGRTKINDARSMAPGQSLQQVIYRIVPVLSLISFASSSAAPGLLQLSITALIRCVHWVTFIALCHQGYALDLSAITTMSLLITRLRYNTMLIEDLGGMFAAIASIAQILFMFPGPVHTRHAVGFFTCLVLISVCVKAYFYVFQDNTLHQWLPVPEPLLTHPIAQAYTKAEMNFEAMVKSQSRTLADATQEYQRRYSRPPPLHFDKWFELAQANNMVLIDEFDVLMQTIERFWSVPPSQLRLSLDELFEHPISSVARLSIRNHHLEEHPGNPEHLDRDPRKWLSVHAEYLPDMKLVFNTADEPRIVLQQDSFQASQSWSGDNIADDDYDASQKNTVWNLSIRSCPSDSPSRRPSAWNYGYTNWSDISFIENPNRMEDLCDWPQYASLFNFIGSSKKWNITDVPGPVFTTAKLSTFQDILYPSPDYEYLSEKPYRKNSHLDSAWESKESSVYWAGRSTGGVASTLNWLDLVRQRLVKFVNDARAEITVMEQTRENDSSPWTWTLRQANMAELSKLFRVRMVSIVDCTWLTCLMLEKYFVRPYGKDPSHLAFNSKLVLDLDGRGHSGRYYRLLQSNSAVLKQTLFQEWHDDWIVPWLHYIPVSIGMQELPEIIRWLLKTKEGDHLASRIAEMGKAWHNRVLREIDMELVFFRLMLEYGRLLNDDRE